MGQGNNPCSERIGSPHCCVQPSCCQCHHPFLNAPSGREVDKWLGGRLKPTVIEDAAQLKASSEGAELGVHCLWAFTSQASPTPQLQHRQARARQYRPLPLCPHAAGAEPAGQLRARGACTGALLHHVLCVEPAHPFSAQFAAALSGHFACTRTAAACCACMRCSILVRLHLRNFCKQLAQQPASYPHRLPTPSLPRSPTKQTMCSA